MDFKRQSNWLRSFLRQEHRLRQDITTIQLQPGLLWIKPQIRRARTRSISTWWSCWIEQYFEAEEQSQSRNSSTARHIPAAAFEGTEEQPGYLRLIGATIQAQGTAELYLPAGNDWEGGSRLLWKPGEHYDEEELQYEHGAQLLPLRHHLIKHWYGFIS